MAAPIVRLAGVCKSFRSASGASVVLETVDLAIAAGQKVSLIGPSGCGKSTLLSLMAGLLRPDSGTVEIDGNALADLADDATAVSRVRRIGIALQSDNLIPFLSALENVELALGFGGGGDTARPARVVLDRMGVAHRADHKPRQLSGGEAQRVAVGVALANAPALLLADEMVAQLDSATAEAVVGDVFNSDMAVLFVTHDPALAGGRSAHIVQLSCWTRNMTASRGLRSKVCLVGTRHLAETPPPGVRDSVSRQSGFRKPPGAEAGRFHWS